MESNHNTGFNAGFELGANLNTGLVCVGMLATGGDIDLDTGFELESNLNTP